MLEKEQVSEKLHIVKSIPFEGSTWEFRAFGLAIPKGITTKLRKDTSNYGDAIWIDWHNILNEPAKARVNILINLIGVSKRSFIESYLRTQDVLESIQIYNEVLMQEGKPNYSAEEIEKLLMNGYLPRPEVAFIDADRPRLDIFFKQKGFMQTGEFDKYAYSIPWAQLVAMAKDGNLPLY